MLFEYLESGAITVVGLIIGVLLTTPLVLYQESRVDERLRRLPFLFSLLSRALLYMGSLAAVFMSTGFVIGGLAGLSLSDFWASLREPVFALQLTVGFGLYLVLLFFRQLDRLLGPGVLTRYLLGRYHHPRREKRIFMFLDLKSSTTLAEQLGPEPFLAMVNEFFRDLSGPVLDSAGEIYEYVGDEVVLTWPAERGLHRGNCIRVFFDIEGAIAKKRSTYMDRFGVVPDFKAGLHIGEVMTAEVGDLKRSLVFNGDVLNTGARIESQCNRLGKRFLASSDLLRQIDDMGDWRVEEMGEVELRGKREPLALAALSSR